jgi:putative nucleotidyltransferase with HDIG domain
VRFGTSTLVTTAGLAVLAAAAVHAASAPLGPLTLLAAAVIVAELLEQAETGRSREPVETQSLRPASGVHLAAIVVLGPWPGALLAGGGVFAASRFRGVRWRASAFQTSAFALAALAGGYGFEAAGGRAATLALPDDLLPLAALSLAYLGVRTALLELVRSGEAFHPELRAAAAEAGLGTILALFALHNPWNLLALAPLAVAVHDAHSRIRRLRRETLHALETLANIVDERDPSTYRHSLRVAGYVDALARALRLPFSDIDRLRWAGRLHDLGKVAVDAAVLGKQGRLDSAEWAAVRRHPRLSARLLQRFEFTAGQAQAVEFHHERYDGNGYYGVRGDELPLASHFLIVADSFDAMTTDRPYRRGLTREEALAEIERNLGSQFHPVVAKAFVAVERGLDPEQVLTAEELTQLRGASVSTRLGVVPGGRDLKERPELLALGGVVLALVGLGFDQRWVAVAGAVLATLGLVFRAVARARSERLTEALRRALHAPTRPALFDQLLDRLERSWAIDFACLLSWDEDGLGGSIELSRGEGPGESALLSWLVREAESGADVIVTPGAELGRDGILLALPLRRESSALAGFLVLEGQRLPPRHVELALLETLDEVGLALAARPVEAAAPRLASVG